MVEWRNQLVSDRMSIEGGLPKVPAFGRTEQEGEEGTSSRATDHEHGHLDIQGIWRGGELWRMGQVALGREVLGGVGQALD